MKFFLTASIVFFLGITTFAQKKNDAYNYYIKRATSAIKVDGKDNEAAWQDIQIADNFWQIQPLDTGRSVVKTAVKLCYDDKNLYVLFINYNKEKTGNVVESMRRDFAFNSNDNDLLFLDTFNDQINGFSFGSNARGGQWDGLMSNGSNINLSWENRWFSEVAFDDEKWTWEAAIPFKTLRYKSDATKWGINFSRLDLKGNEKSGWAPVPRQFPSAALAYTGNLVWDVPPPAPKANIAIVPFVTGGITKNHVENLPTDYNRSVGFDAKIGLTSSLNLDLTVNPDFSQVEVDVQQTNLDRFELFFPERRQFFLENGDLFNNFGYGNIRPFFSRRVGLDAPIFYGGRVSGNVNKNLRIGAMTTQTGKNSKGELGSNYSVVSLQHKVFARSNVAAIFVNRQTTAFGEQSPVNSELADYNRTLGFEYNLQSKDNQWQGKALYLKTFSPLAMQGGDNNVVAGSLYRSTQKIYTGIQIERVGNEVNGNETGFIRRKNYVYLAPRFNYYFFTKSSKTIVSHGPFFFTNRYLNNETFKEFEYVNVGGYDINFLNRAILNVWTAKDYVQLNAAFDPTNYVGETLAKDTEHTWNSVGLNYTSTQRKLLTYALGLRTGGYYANGTRHRVDASLGYRFQPYMAITLNAGYNQLNFKEDEVLPQKLRNKSYDLWLIGQRLDVTFSNKLFLTNFVQYNNQTNNLNLNTRLQWRYSPASDLFIVYTDNYFADTLRVRNRAIALKFTYWWNV
jgi:Domain of unknown function (DUF5916)/Carbohydrate family 9 binding domain-like